MIETVWPAKLKIFTVCNFEKKNGDPSTRTTGFPSRIHAGWQGTRYSSGPAPWLLPVSPLDSLYSLGMASFYPHCLISSFSAPVTLIKMEVQICRRTVCPSGPSPSFSVPSLKEGTSPSAPAYLLPIVSCSLSLCPLFLQDLSMRQTRGCISR